MDLKCRLIFRGSCMQEQIKDDLIKLYESMELGESRKSTSAKI